MPLVNPPVAPASAITIDADGWIHAGANLPFKILGALQADGSTHYTIKVLNAQGQPVDIHTADR